MTTDNYRLSAAKRKANRFVGKLLLVVLALVFFMPFYWMVATALKDSNYIFAIPPQWIPNPVIWTNFVDIFSRMDIIKYLKNSLVVAAVPVVGQLLASPMIAYSLTKIPWKGPKYIFPIVMVSMMLPWQVTQIPMYTIWKKLDMINTFIPLVLPAFFGSAYYIYLLRQFMKSLPDSLIEAARIDGAGEFRILYFIIYPMCKTVLTTIAVLIFVWGWNDLNGPLLYLQSSSTYTLSIGLQMFLSSEQPEWNLLMAASTLFTLPLIVIFFSAQKVFLGDVSVTSGLK